MDINRAIVESASWRLASTIVRRHPTLKIIRMHPGGGLYDVLCVLDAAAESTESITTKLMLNRTGTIQVHGRADGESPPSVSREWADFLLHPRPLEFIEQLEHDAGLPSPVIQPLTKPCLIYLTIATLASLGTIGEPFRISEGFIDSAGPAGSDVASWMEELRWLPGELRGSQPSDLFGIPEYRFWRIERPGFQLTFETSTASAWSAAMLRESRHLAGLDRPTTVASMDAAEKIAQRLIRASDLAALAKVKPLLPETKVFNPHLLPYGQPWPHPLDDSAAGENYEDLDGRTLALARAALVLGATH